MHDPKNAWAEGGLSLSEAVLARVDEEARAGYGRDEESCGFLIGPADDALEVDGVLPMENRANKLHALDPESYPRTGRMYFDIDGLAFAKKVRSQAALGQPVKVLYHSHLDVGAYFSPTDAQAATMGGDEPPYDLAYLVVSVRKQGETVVVDDRKLFIWDGTKREFVPASFVVRAVKGVKAS
jgi:[CysO sulfur-carrier protein]-S-L-cysteine hydrolase